MCHSKCKFTFKVYDGIDSELRNKGCAEEHLRGTDVMPVTAGPLCLGMADFGTGCLVFQNSLNYCVSLLK